MSNFDDIVGLFEIALVYESKTREETRKNVLEKLCRKWNQLEFSKSRDIVYDKFEAIQLLLNK